MRDKCGSASRRGKSIDARLLRGIVRAEYRLEMTKIDKIIVPQNRYQSSCQCPERR